MNPNTNSTQMLDLVSCLEEKSALQPGKILYTFLGGEEAKKPESVWTHLDLARQARRVAAKLQELDLKGERALLLYPPGLDYIGGFFGCLYSGVIAVPAYPPDPSRLERTLPRLLAIIKDCRAKVILTTQMILDFSSVFQQMEPALADLQWIATDALPEVGAQDWRSYTPQSQDIAFLQYTSGSTGEPKGVILSHQNLIDNLAMIQKSFGVVSEQEMGVSWLPPYHDMGLIGGILGPLYTGVSTVLMSPLHFLQSPVRWLEAISKYGATTSGGPNFAYELCLRKVTPEQKANLDLSQWSLAFTGAEPISLETLQRFSESFAECGFQSKSFYPCYGLAEATLIVSGAVKGEGFVSRAISRDAYRQHELQPADLDADLHLVSSGIPVSGQEIRVVRPDLLSPCQENEVGEIWLQGPNVAQGYWQQPELSQEVFQARLKDGSGPFLRTGDLGFISQGQVFITGRLKDLLIIRGTNHYPQDIEKTVDGVHPALRPGCSAAFSIRVQQEERLVIVQEVEKALLKNGEEELFAKIRSAIADKHDLKVYAILLIEKGSIPKTSSGKIRRQACREAYLAKTLNLVSDFQAALERESLEKPARDVTELKVMAGPSDLRLVQIRQWLIQRMSEQLGISEEEIHVLKPLSEYGLDSRDAVNISGDLQDWLGFPLSPTVLWKYPTIESLSQYLVSEETQEIAS